VSPHPTSQGMVFRSFVDLNELCDQVVLPAVGEIVTTRHVSLRMVDASEGVFLPRSARPGSIGFPRVNPLVLKGVVRLQGSRITTRGRLSWWSAAFFGGYLGGCMVGAALTVVSKDPKPQVPALTLAMPIVMVAFAGLLARIALRNARLDAQDAAADVAAILSGRTDLARAYPDANGRREPGREWWGRALPGCSYRGGRDRNGARIVGSRPRRVRLWGMKTRVRAATPIPRPLPRSPQLASGSTA
jgi:hypothetical protein